MQKTSIKNGSNWFSNQHWWTQWVYSMKDSTDWFKLLTWVCEFFKKVNKTNESKESCPNDRWITVELIWVPLTSTTNFIGLVLFSPLKADMSVYFAVLNMYNHMISWFLFAFSIVLHCCLWPCRSLLSSHHLKNSFLNVYWYFHGSHRTLKSFVRVGCFVLVQEITLSCSVN